MSDPRITDKAKPHNHMPRCCCPVYQVAPDDHDYEPRGGRLERDSCPACPVHATPQPVVDREALLQLLDDYAVGRYVPEDLPQHRAFMADAIERLLNGTAE